jgi:hypothetical protein
MKKEVVVAQFEALTQHLEEETEEHHKNLRIMCMWVKISTWKLLDKKQAS